MSEHDLAGPVDLGVSQEERLLALMAQALVPGASRAELAGALNARLERLSSEATPAEAASALQCLLAQRGLEQLEDERGMPSRIVATRELLALGHPHALAITPEQLETLRRWERDAHPLPWESLVIPLLVAAAVQVWLVGTGRADSRYMFPETSIEVLASSPPMEVPWEDVLWAFCRDEKGAVFWGQLLANLCAFLFVQHASALGPARKRLRLAFLVMGLLGGVASVAQLGINPVAALGTLVSAGGSMVAVWRLRAQ